MRVVIEERVLLKSCREARGCERGDQADVRVTLSADWFRRVSAPLEREKEESKSRRRASKLTGYVLNMGTSNTWARPVQRNRAKPARREGPCAFDGLDATPLG